MNSFIDYYDLLGVDPRAAANTIKAAFKKLALKYHPDVYKGEDAEERMRIILHAYQTLSDPASRRTYDLERAEHLFNARGATQDGWQRVQVAGEHHSASPREDATRRDNQRAFAFPDLNVNLSAPLRLSLGDGIYELAPDDAFLLRQDGLLRGVESQATGGVAPVPGRPRENYCHRCHHRWVPAGSASRAAVCPACKASDWAEYLLLRCVHCHAVFESEELHDKIIGGGRLYFPYELFPLCPHCRRSQWCPAENVRIDALRAATARRRLILWMSVLVVAVVVIGVMAAVMLR